jgi:hypothetical protein
MRTTPEQIIQQQIIKWLRPYSYEYGGPIILHVRSGNSGEPEGAADLWLCVNGHHVEVEVKAPGGERSSAQERWERICKRTGALYIVTDSLFKFIEFITPLLSK